MRKFYKALIFVFIFLGLVALTFLGIGGVKAYRAVKENTFELVPATAPKEEFIEVNVGERVPVTLKVKTSLAFEQDLSFEFDLPEGVDSVLSPKQDCHVDFGTYEHEIEFPIIPFHEGEFEKLTLRITGTVSGEKKTIVADLPKIKAILPEFSADEQIGLEDELQSPTFVEKYSWRILLIALAVLLILIAAGIYLLLRKRVLTPPPLIPPWIIAETKLKALKTDLEAGKLGAVIAVVKISDVVRTYLSERFEVPADSMTTQEFFTSLERYNSPLPTKHRPFLRKFLQDADKVKFAGAIASNELVLDALTGAETLVNETVPVIEEKNNG